MCIYSVVDLSRWSHFAASATFGPTRRSLAQLEPTSRLAWLQAQQELPASLLRARYRRFANPRQLDARLPGKVRGPCQPGARWQQAPIEGSKMDFPLRRGDFEIF